MKLAILLAALLAMPGCAGCGDSSPSTSSDAGTDSGDNVLIIEPEIPLANCDVAFDRVYEIPGAISARAWSVVELPSGHFVVAGEATPEVQTTLWDVDGFLMEVDAVGEVVWVQTYGKEDTGEYDTEVLQRIHLVPNGLLALGTKVEDDQNKGAWAMRTALDGGVDWSEILPTSGTSNTFQLDEETIQYLGGNDTGQKVLATVDAQGVFAEQYQGAVDPFFITGWNRHSSGYSAMFGHLYVDGVEGNHVPDDTSYKYPYAKILDPSYEEMASVTFDPGKSGGFSALAGAPDERLLFGGWLLYDDWFWGAYLAKVTVEGEALWQRFYGLNGCNGIDDVLGTEDGYLYVGEAGGNGIYDGYIGKVDEDGKLIWHFIPDHEGENGFAGVIETSDGSWLAVGVAEYDYKWAPFKAWLVKITPNGECY